MEKMRKISFRFVFIMLLFNWNGLDVLFGKSLQKIEYFEDSIMEKDGEYIQLLGGSSWLLSLPSLALITDDVIIVFQEIELKNKKQAKVAVAYIDGEEILAKHIDGIYITQTGYLSTVVEVLGEGALLKLANGFLLSIPEYDQYDTGWWLPPYKVLLTGNMLYMYNLDKGKKVWVDSVK
jgi:hypothetical protein